MLLLETYYYIPKTWKQPGATWNLRKWNCLEKVLKQHQIVPIDGDLLSNGPLRSSKKSDFRYTRILSSQQASLGPAFPLGSPASGHHRSQLTVLSKRQGGLGPLDLGEEEMSQS